MAGGIGELAIGDDDPAHYIGELRQLSVPNMVSCRMSYWGALDALIWDTLT